MTATIRTYAAIGGELNGRALRGFGSMTEAAGETSGVGTPEIAFKEVVAIGQALRLWQWSLSDAPQIFIVKADGFCWLGLQSDAVDGTGAPLGTKVDKQHIPLSNVGPVIIPSRSMIVNTTNANLHTALFTGSGNDFTGQLTELWAYVKSDAVAAVTVEGYRVG